MNKEICKKIINDENSDKSIKQIISNELKLSSRIISNMKNNKGIKVNNEVVNINYIVKTGDILELSVFDQSTDEILPEKIDINIIFEDEELLVINKPPGMIVHPTSFHQYGTLANAVMYYYNSIRLSTKFRPVNRLDKDTSGIIIIAKSQLSHSIISQQMQKNIFKKEYIAVVHNEITEKCGTIDLPIGRNPDSLIERMISSNGQNAVTEYEALAVNNLASVVKIRLITGRTHQIRVHFNHIGHPLFGDSLYGSVDNEIGRQALHCRKICFNHPKLNEPLMFECKIPNDIIDLLNKLNLDIMQNNTN